MTLDGYIGLTDRGIANNLDEAKAAFRAAWEG
jgi:hypothetical protein